MKKMFMFVTAIVCLLVSDLFAEEKIEPVVKEDKIEIEYVFYKIDFIIEDGTITVRTESDYKTLNYVYPLIGTQVTMLGSESNDNGRGMIAMSVTDKDGKKYAGLPQYFFVYETSKYGENK